MRTIGQGSTIWRATMIAIEHKTGSRAAGRWLAGCLLASSMTLGAVPTAAESNTETSIDATLLEQVMMRPEPLEWMTKRFFRDNPGCVSAKLDIWFWRGHYTHQLFTAHSGGMHDLGTSPAPGEPSPKSQQALEGDKDNPTTRQLMDADSTTVVVGREGCRYRIRIERVRVAPRGARQRPTRRGRRSRPAKAPPSARPRRSGS